MAYRLLSFKGEAMTGSLMSFMPEGVSHKHIPILVVDDSRDNLDLMEALLVGEGFETVLLAASGQEALSFLADHDDIGLVLLDMMMPGMDGYEVCRRIFESEAWRHIPVIIVTGGALRRNEALEKSFAAGAMDFITKPINEVELLTRIGSALTLYRERVMRLSKTRELEESETKFRITFDQAPVGIAHVDLEGRILMVNQRLCDMLGYPYADLQGLSFGDLRTSENGTQHYEPLRDLGEKGGPVCSAEVSLVHRQGRIVRTQLTLSPLREPSGKLKYFIYVVEDISTRKQAEESMRLAATVFDSSTEAIIISDARGDIVKVNRAFTEITGYRPEEALGKNPRLLSSGRHDAAFYKAMWATLNSAGQWEGEIINRRKSGEIYPSWLTLSAVKDDKGVVTNYVGISVDITMRKEHEERLSFLANHDALTRLPNRILFSDRLQHAMTRAHREVLKMGILFLDLDRFKEVNDNFGHNVGDFLLQGVGERLACHIRASDTLARWGGDEFILLLEKIRSPEDAVLVAQRILKVLSEPFKVDDRELFIRGSIGVSIFPDDGEDVGTLLSTADSAMYRAKERGGNNYQLFLKEESTITGERPYPELDQELEPNCSPL
jgi:diguanylate cyclase (GGDEF)-like protein/PAS domain S-box-containing protein